MNFTIRGTSWYLAFPTPAPVQIVQYCKWILHSNKVRITQTLPTYIYNPNKAPDKFQPNPKDGFYSYYN